MTLCACNYRPTDSTFAFCPLCGHALKATDRKPRWVRIKGATITLKERKTNPTEVVADFEIARYPTTNAEYMEFVQATGHEWPSHWEGGKIPVGKENHPVVNVSWHDANAYCKWLSEKTGSTITLPTEAQWELAAGGVEGRKYPWGNEEPTYERANYYGSKWNGTSPVGTHPKGVTPEGVEDMAGNVWEWVSDEYRR